MELDLRNFENELDMSLIDIAEDNVRKSGQERGLQDLADSISKYGLLQPVTVFLKDGRYKLLVGQRRFLACKKIGWTTIPAFIIGGLNSKIKTIVSYSENAHRTKLPYEDSVQACSKLFDHYTGSKKERIEKIRKDLGITEYQVAKFLAHVLVPSAVRKLVTEGKLSEDFVLRLTATYFPDTNKIIEIANSASRMTKAETQRALEYGKKHPEASVKEIMTYAKNPPPQLKLILHFEPDTMNRIKDTAKYRRMSIETFVKDAIERSIEEE